MLSSVLKNKQATQVNIQIMRVYTRIREMLLAHKDVFIYFEQVEKQLMKYDQKIEYKNQNIDRIQPCFNPKVLP